MTRRGLFLSLLGGLMAAPRDGRIASVAVGTGQQVVPGQVLLRLDA